VARRQRYLLDMIKEVWPLIPDYVPVPEVMVPPPPDPRDTMKELLKQGESESVEFKSSFRYDYDLDTDNKALVTGPVQTAAAFMNTGGGTLLVGVADEGDPLGLDQDLSLMKGRGKDGLERYFRQALINAVGAKFTTGVGFSFHELDGNLVCRIDVEPSTKPVFIQKMVEGIVQKQFYIRSGNGNRELDAQSAHDYIEMHW
jgi:predicted HTH transcriptional regulator